MSRYAGSLGNRLRASIPPVMALGGWSVAGDQQHGQEEVGAVVAQGGRWRGTRPRGSGTPRGRARRRRTRIMRTEMRSSSVTAADRRSDRRHDAVILDEISPAATAPGRRTGVWAAARHHLVVDHRGTSLRRVCGVEASPAQSRNDAMRAPDGEVLHEARSRPWHCVMIDLVARGPGCGHGLSRTWRGVNHWLIIRRWRVCIGVVLAQQRQRTFSGHTPLPPLMHPLRSAGRSRRRPS